MMEQHVFGARYAADHTDFSLWAPGSIAVTLQLHATGSDAEEGSKLLRFIPMQQGEDDVYTVRVDGDLDGVYYVYQLTYASGRETISADPWARACGVNGVRSMVVNLQKTDPAGWTEDHRIGTADMAPVIWETHVGDFSADASSGVQEAWRGKYLGFTEQPAQNTGLAYLKQLGITHIQLQPIADYCTVDERVCKDYNWGYDSENFNIPEGSFSTDPFHGAVRIRECKQMIQAIHRAGFGVIMDVVYNHTYHKDSWLERTAPKQYYRMNENGEFMNASGCGTETASERPAFRNYMLQSVLYWAKEYHIDGFRFDLMAIHDVETMNMIRDALDTLPGGRDILLYGEPWAALPPAIRHPSVSANQRALRQMNDRIGIFSDDTKVILCGKAFNDKDTGWASGNAHDWQDHQLQSMLTGWCRRDLESYANVPGQMVHYVSCHDNFTLWDRLVAGTGSRAYDGNDETAMRRNRLASGVVLMSIGLSFFQSGEEFRRTKHGNGNTYNGPAAENSLKWGDVTRYHELVAWYRGLIAIRHEMYPDTARETAEKLRFLDAQFGMVAFLMPCREKGRWSEVLVAFNPFADAHPMWVPDGEWQVLCDGTDSELWKKEVRTVTGYTQLPAASLMIFAKPVADKTDQK